MRSSRRRIRLGGAVYQSHGMRRGDAFISRSVEYRELFSGVEQERPN
jgi:hypothetical protein